MDTLSMCPTDREIRLERGLPEHLIDATTNLTWQLLTKRPENVPTKEPA